MKNASMIKAQAEFLAARVTLTMCENGYKNELVTSGVHAKIDAWVEGDLEPEAQAMRDVIFNKWGMKDTIAEMDRAELALVSCLLTSIEKRTPSKRGMVATLRKHVAESTRYCPRRIEMAALALEWKW